MRHTKNRTLLLLLLLVLLGGGTPARAQTPTETFTATREAEVYGTPFASQRTSVATHNGSIYFAYVDGDMRTVIAKKAPDSTITTTVIFDQTMDDSHNGPSIGIDRDGYIHVAGNMHHAPYSFPDNSSNPYYDYAWQYVVSDNPEDISSFTFRGGDPERTIPGTSVTYPFFARDNHGVLFVSFRIRVRLGGWDEGDLGAAIARYDADAQRWTMLGGTDYRHGTRVFFWNDSGASHTAYQPYGPHLRFDHDNRLHVAWVVDDGSGSSGHHTHVAYAASSDGGETFERADGSAHTSLPITLATADVVAGNAFASSVGGFSYRSCVDVMPDGSPVVVVPTERQSGNQNFLSSWSPDRGWSEPRAYPSCYRARFVIDTHGVITTVGTGGSAGMSRSFDGGETWKSYAVETNPGFAFDFPYFEATNQMRYTARFSSGRMRVWTVHFSGTEPPSEASEEAEDPEEPSEPEPTVFSPVPVAGDRLSYDELTPSRWTVIEDQGDPRYFLRTTDYTATEEGALGEYALLAEPVDDFDMSLNARSAEPLVTNTYADICVVFGAEDAGNYSFLMLNAASGATQLHRVVEGVRVAGSPTAAWTLGDNDYHVIQIRRRGQAITVSVDDAVLFDLDDVAIPPGQVGVGSYNDSVYFDDIQVTPVDPDDSDDDPVSDAADAVSEPSQSDPPADEPIPVAVEYIPIGCRALPSSALGLLAGLLLMRRRKRGAGACVVVAAALVHPVAAADFFVRPSSGEYGIEDGTSFETAFDGFANIDWVCRRRGRRHALGLWAVQRARPDRRERRERCADPHSRLSS